MPLTDSTSACTELPVAAATSAGISYASSELPASSVYWQKGREVVPKAAVVTKKSEASMWDELSKAKMG